MAKKLAPAVDVHAISFLGGARQYQKAANLLYESDNTLRSPIYFLYLHANRFAAHLPVKGLLKLLGLDMAELINARKTRGISVDDNDIILDPAQMLPPPKMRGRITGVRIQGDEIIQTFGKDRTDSAMKRPHSNYIAYRGGVLRFGKLTMDNADMRLIDADPADPFDFFPDHYKDHLVAGYSKTTALGGLLVYMPDYDKISKSLSPR